MTDRSTCARCGATLSVGRFCTNCGAPREEAAVPVTVPPPVHQAPPPPRFPLYADEPMTTATAPIPVVPAGPGHGGRHRRRPWLAWLATALVLVLLAVLGVALLGGGEDDPAGPASDSTSDSPTAEGSDSAPDGFQGEPQELAGLATADAPASDADSVDIATGEPTTYDPANMLDGDPATGWRVSGDATGTVLTFTFDEPVTLTSVGLVNGYAKTSVDGSGTEFDLYTGSRRVLEVEWVLDGGEPIPQSLVDGERELQLLDVGAVESSTVELRLVAVSDPGGGAGARDKTAISEVALSGYPS